MENPDKDELIAYLDGELDPRTSQQVEERLKHDPAYRQVLSQYERSWDMLDRLERATVGENFSRTTLEMVSVAAAEEQQPLPRWGRFGAFALCRIGIVALAAVAASLLGYAERPRHLARPQSRIAARSSDLGKPRFVRAGRFDRLFAEAGRHGLVFGAAGQAKARRRASAAAESPEIAAPKSSGWRRSSKNIWPTDKTAFSTAILWPKRTGLAKSTVRSGQGADGRQLRKCW